MTYSIVAVDTATGDLGIAVQSRFLAVASVVPYARAGVGAIATQAFANPSFGPRGLDLLGAGATAPQTLDVLVMSDACSGRRQAAIVDIRGRVAVHTGSECAQWGGHIIGDHFGCQGNILVSIATVEAMAVAMERAPDLPLPERLLQALDAGEAAGGDARGQQSAGLLVVRMHGGYGALSDRYVDLRVDDAVEPIKQLGHLLRLHRLYFERPAEESLVRIDAGLAKEVAQRIAEVEGVPAEPGDPDKLRSRLEKWAGRQNLEERMIRKGFLDPLVLRILRGEDVLGDSSSA